MTKQEKLQKVCQAILTEAKDRGCNFLDRTYNKDYMVEIELTVEELRWVYDLFKRE